MSNRIYNRYAYAINGAVDDSIDAPDYGHFKRTNRISVSYQCAGYEAGTLPEAQALRKRMKLNEPIQMTVNSKSFLL